MHRRRVTSADVFQNRSDLSLLFQVFVNFAKDQSDEDHFKEVNLNKRDAVVVDLSQLNPFLADNSTRESCV